MKDKIFALISLLMILLLVGCSAQQPSAPAQQKVDTTVKVETQTQPAPIKVETKEEVIKTTPKPQPTVTVQAPVQLPERVQELITKSQTKIKSYQYLLSEPPENRFLNTYFVKGDKIKIKLYEGNAYIIGKWQDTVYLDRAVRTATARCEDEKRCLYRGEDYTRKVFEADYDTYNTKTPTEWLNEVTNAEVIGPEVVDGVSAMKIKTTQPGKIINLWLHTTYGVPVKVEVTESGQSAKVYQFSDSTFNHLKDSDVAPRFTTSQY